MAWHTQEGRFFPGYRMALACIAGAPLLRTETGHREKLFHAVFAAPVINAKYAAPAQRPYDRPCDLAEEIEY